MSRNAPKFIHFDAEAARLSHKPVRPRIQCLRDESFVHYNTSTFSGLEPYNEQGPVPGRAEISTSAPVNIPATTATTTTTTTMAPIGLDIGQGKPSVGVSAFKVSTADSMSNKRGASALKSEIWVHFSRTPMTGVTYQDKRTGKIKTDEKYECKFAGCGYATFSSKIQGSTSPLRYHYGTHIRDKRGSRNEIPDGDGEGEDEDRGSNRITRIDNKPTQISESTRQFEAYDSVPGAHIDPSSDIEVASTIDSGSGSSELDSMFDPASRSSSVFSSDVNDLLVDLFTKYNLDPRIADDEVFLHLIRTRFTTEPLNGNAIQYLMRKRKESSYRTKRKISKSMNGGLRKRNRI